MIIKETLDWDLTNYKKAGYAFAIGNWETTDVYCFDSRLVCLKFYNEFIACDNDDEYNLTMLDKKAQKVVSNHLLDVNWELCVEYYNNEYIFIDQLNSNYYVLVSEDKIELDI